MSLVFSGLAEICVRPPDEHQVAVDLRHDAHVILAAAPDRRHHSQLDLRRPSIGIGIAVSVPACGNATALAIE